MAQSLIDIKVKITSCTVCGAITESDPCLICTDPKRDDNLICIVEDAPDIYVFEKTNSFRGFAKNDIYCQFGCLGLRLVNIKYGPADLTNTRMLDKFSANRDQPRSGRDQPSPTP